MRTAKLVTATLIVLFFVSSFISAQEANDFFSRQDAKTTWLGVDFSEVRVMGDAGATPSEMKDKYFVSINDIIITEAEKYNFSKAFKKSFVGTDLTMVSKINSKIDVEKIKTYNSEDMTRLKPEMINQMVSKYDFGDKKGYGIVFIMESLNKQATQASMYVTIINMDTKKVVATKRMTAKPMGFGFKNYWARTVYNVLQELEKSGF